MDPPTVNPGSSPRTDTFRHSTYDHSHPSSRHPNQGLPATARASCACVHCRHSHFPAAPCNQTLYVSGARTGPSRSPSQPDTVIGHWNATVTLTGQTVTVRGNANTSTVAPDGRAEWGFQASRPDGSTALSSDYTCTPS